MCRLIQFAAATAATEDTILLTHSSLLVGRIVNCREFMVRRTNERMDEWMKGMSLIKRTNGYKRKSTNLFDFFQFFFMSLHH